MKKSKTCIDGLEQSIRKDKGNSDDINGLNMENDVIPFAGKQKEKNGDLNESLGDGPGKTEKTGEPE